ncbi:MAG: hypothetical protein ACJAYR_002487 [Sneathiella sp.]
MAANQTATFAVPETPSLFFIPDPENSTIPETPIRGANKTALR